MSEIYEDGLTMDQASPDLNEVASEPVADEPSEGAEVAEIPQEETPAPEKKPKTKTVSDRINAIRAEGDARLKELQEKFDRVNHELLVRRANEEGIPVEELAARDRMEEENFKEALHNDPEFRELQQRDFERQKNEVLTQLQDAFPKDGIEDLDVLPQDFFRMLQAGVSPVTAYRASVADAQKSTPPSTGSVKSQGTQEGAITTEQLEGMSTREIIENWDKIFPDG